MKRRVLQDPYRAFLDQFNQKGVRYVVVGLSGINYYAKSLRETFATLDYDVFLDPSLTNVQRAIKVLLGLGFTLGTAEGIFRDSEIKKFVRYQKTLIATTSEGLMVELLLKVSGYSFSELARDAATFTAEGVPIRVGRLSKLLKSKFLAGRPKDRQFLKRYRLLLEGSD